MNFINTVKETLEYLSFFISENRNSGFPQIVKTYGIVIDLKKTKFIYLLQLRILLYNNRGY